jgi:Dip2/Utp12 Family
VAEDDTHLGLVTTNYSTLATCLTVMDRTRGVVLYTVACDNTPATTATPSTATTKSLKKEKTSSAAQCIGVLAAATSSHFYIVSLSKNQNQDRPVVLYECDVATGQVRRKIKLGRYKYTGSISMLSEEEEEWNHYGFAIVPTAAEDAIAVAVFDGGGHGESHRLRGVQLSNGHKLYQRPCGSESPNSSRRLCVRATEVVSVVINTSRGAWELFQTNSGRVIPLCAADLSLGVAISADRTWQLAASNDDTVFILSQGESKKELLQIQLLRAASNSNATGPVVYESYSIERVYLIQWNDGDNDDVTDRAESSQRLFLHTHPVDSSIQLVAVQYQDALRVQHIPLAPSNMAALASTSTEKEDLVELSISFEKNSSPMPPTAPLAEPVQAEAKVNPTTLVSEAPTPSSRKRKEPPTVLGPGQAGGEAPLTEDPPRSHTASTKDDRDEGEKPNVPTVGERLRLLRQALEEESDEDEAPRENVESEEQKTSFVARHATTESLTQLVAQALQSSDGSMLEQALQVRDPNVLRTTCKSLTAEQVMTLWDAILQRLAQKPNRAEQLVAWVTALLQSNHIIQVQHLQPLQNLLAERLEVFPQLIQLEGRLESMVGL